MSPIDIKLKPVAKRDSGRLVVSRFSVLAGGIQKDCSRTHVMRLIAEPMRIHFSLVVLLPLLITGCSSVTYDHRDAIARATLFTSKGVIDERAFSGALMEKFSTANSPPAALADFIESLGGRCSSRLTNSLLCTIPQSGGFCVASRIDVEAVVADGAITSIRAKAKNDGC